MSKIEKLTKLKNKILDKMITPNSVEKVRSKLTFKGSTVKEFFKYQFKFLLKTEGNLIAEEYDEQRAFNPILMALSGVFLTSLMVSLFFPQLLLLSLTSLSITVFLVVLLNITFKMNIIHNNEIIKKRFDYNKTEQIKKNLTISFNKKEINMLIERGLTKEELEKTFKIIDETIGKEKFFEMFKSLGLAKKNKEISDPHSLILTIEAAIKHMKMKGENNKMEENEKENLIKNGKIFSSLIQEEKEEQRQYETV